MRSPVRSSGFTAIEVIIVSAILVLLLTLLMPGLLYSREAAAQARCLNNLQQLGVALANYEAIMNVLPPGCINPTGPIRNEPIGYHMSWVAQSTAVLDQANLYETLEWNYGAYAPTSSGAAGVALPTLQCSADPEIQRTPASSYAGSIGGSSYIIDVDNTGLLYLNSSVSGKDIPDGRAHTLLVGEVRVAPALVVSGLGWTSGTSATLRSAGVALNSTRNTDYEVVTDTAGGFGSWHEGVVPFLYADGAVKSMNVNTAQSVMTRLGDRSDGMTVEHRDDVFRRRARNQKQLEAIRAGELSP